MPLTDKGNEIMSAMKSQYGDKKGEQVFYASKNAGKIAGVDTETPAPAPTAAIIAAKPEGADDTAGEGPHNLPPLAERLDEVRDRLHELSRRCDALERMDWHVNKSGQLRKDDRSAEEHAAAAKFHEEEAERGDDDDDCT